MISVLLPTRKRPLILQRMIESVWLTSSKPIEIILYIDNDDTESAAMADQLAVKKIIGPRITLSDCWNKCAEIATGDIWQQSNDDVVYRTYGWDIIVENFYSQTSDKIWFTHPYDSGGYYKDFGAHGFVHRRWADVVGFFIAPWFSSDYGDTFLNDCANALNRRKCLPIIVDHLHFWFGRSECDQTYQERIDRHMKDRPDLLYEKLRPEREAAIEKLRAVMENT